MKDLTKALVFAAATHLSSVNAVEVGPVSLPSLPDHASGAKCNAIDNINREDKDFMRKKLDAVIQANEVFEDGWKVVARGYEIPGMFGGHNNLEILKPDGTMFASIDTQQINRETAEIKGYIPDGHYAAPVIDDCTLGNGVVMEDKRNMFGEITVVEGTGTQALLVFAKAAQAAVMISDQNYYYRAFPDADEHEVNSNSYGRAFLEAAIGKDAYVSMKAYDNKPLLGSPGLKIDLITDAVSSRYDTIQDKPEMIVLNPEIKDQFLNDLKALHPISQQEKALEHGDNPNSDHISKSYIPFMNESP